MLSYLTKNSKVTPLFRAVTESNGLSHWGGGGYCIGLHGFKGKAGGESHATVTICSILSSGSFKLKTKPRETDRFHQQKCNSSMCTSIIYDQITGLNTS